MIHIAKSCEDGSQAEKESREKDHCRKVSYVTEETSITPRCPGNCACCKQGASSKSSNKHSAHKLCSSFYCSVPIQEGEVPIISVADRNWNDDNIAATFELETSSSEVYNYIITYSALNILLFEATYSGQTMCLRALLTAFMSDASNILSFHEADGDHLYSIEFWIFKPQKSGQQVRWKNHLLQLLTLSSLQ